MWYNMYDIQFFQELKMLYIKSKIIRPGMILAKDIEYYNSDNTTSTLLYKGEVLNQVYINRILYHNIPGVYIESIPSKEISFQPYLTKRLEDKSLSEIEGVFSKLKKQENKLDSASLKQISDIVYELTAEILPKKGLAHNIMEFKNYDDYTYQHCLNVAILNISTGVTLGLDENELHELGICGILHDIGKMFIPLDIINKPGKLTSEEFEIIKTHPMHAINQLRNLVSPDVLMGIESHHEKINGSGYPHGKTGESIPLFGKISAVCDVYDALTSDRSYRKTCFPNEVIEYMMGAAGTLFDYDILKAFLRSIVAYPVGTYVKLSNNIIGVVVKNYSENIMRPIVRIINEDNSYGEAIDLYNDKKFMNITITAMGHSYDSINITASQNTFKL